jgi:uncharacterized membrane protein YphA (DoxX/SURF4 family)
MTKKAITLEIITSLLMLLFIYAGLSKLLDFQTFKVELGKSPLLTAFAGGVALFIPTIEIIIAGILAIPRWRWIGLYAAYSLMLMFTAYIIAILKFSDYIPCSCGGILQNMSWNTHLVFNVVFVLLALTGIMLCDAPHSFAAIKTRGSRKPI